MTDRTDHTPRTDTPIATRIDGDRYVLGRPRDDETIEDFVDRFFDALMGEAEEPEEPEKPGSTASRKKESP